MGSPKNPTEDQIRELEKAGQLQMQGSPAWVNIVNGEAKIEMVMQRQAVSLLRLEW